MNKILLFFSMLLLTIIFPFTLNADPNVIVYSNPVNSGEGNPHLYNPNRIFGQQMIYDTLVYYGKGGVIEPCLAESWEISPDGLEYTFKLRPGVKFSDGEPFNADAVVKNFDTIMKNRERHSWQEVTNKIEKWEAVDDMTFKLTLNEAYAPTLNDLSAFRPYRFLSPKAFPDSGFTADGIKAPIGTGPWKLTEIVPNERDTYERNDLYWGEKPSSEKVIIKVIPDALTRAIALETDQIDLIYGAGQIGYDEFDRFSKDPRYVTKVSPTMNTLTLALNTGKEPTNDKAVRLALNYVINRDEIIQGLFMGHQDPAYTYCAPTFPGCDIGLKPYPFDLDLAAKTLDEAGWVLPAGGTVREKDGKKLEISFNFVGTNASDKSLAEAFQAQASKAGISIILHPDEADMYMTHTREGNFNIVTRETWGPPLEPIAALSGMRRPTDIDYHAQAGLADKAKIDEMIGKMLASVDANERNDYIKQVFTIIHDEAVYVPVHTISLLAAYKAGVFEDFEFGQDRNFIPFNKMKKLK
ncbi:MAG: nickel ABC transporter substrate-binding protein [Deltaproteobacteria bacterium]|jgi:nickel transport system substrate-binding protein|nr:nickel ABC transporter substrate-binding protein [Deltaproteobacteria bacterium]